MDFRKYLTKFSKRIDLEILKVLEKWLKEVEKIDKGLMPLAKAFTKSCKGGKGIRGALCKLGFELSAPSIQKQEIIKIGAAYEILHSSVLIHDDIIDKSSKRRGQKSLHKIVGQSQAITLGDLGFFLAVKIISESKFEEKRKNNALKLFSKTMVQTAMGQMIDIKGGNEETLMKLKTAYYTISAPLQIGAILGGADDNMIGLLGKLGEMLGIAYQARDDVLDKEKVDSSNKLGVEYVAKAKNLIQRITSEKKIQKLLKELADYIIERKK